MRRMTTVVTAVAAAAALGSGLAASSAYAAGSQDRAAATPTCRTAGLKVTLDDGGIPAGDRAGMNHMGTYLRFKNTTGHTCALRGYPGLGLQSASRTALPTHAQWGSTYYADNPGKKTVFLEAGDSAWADLAWTHTGSDASDARFLIVTPPASTTHVTLPFKDLVDGGRLQVTALSDSPPPLR